MMVQIWRDGLPVGMREIPDDVIAAAQKVYAYMGAQDVEQLNGLTLAHTTSRYQNALTRARSVINEVLK